jgi:hypothetical protein
MIRIAKSHHGRCIICRRKTSLHKVKQESIVFAFNNHKILIKHHARCCVRHLDRNGYIKTDQFSFILTQDAQNNKSIKIQLKDMEFLCVKSGIFDEFKNMASLSEETY